MGVGEDLLTEVIRFFNGTSSTVLCFNAPPLNGDYNAPVYTFPSFPTYTLAWVLLAIYPVLVVLAVAAGCCWGVHHDVSNQIRLTADAHGYQHLCDAAGWQVPAAAAAVLNHCNPARCGCTHPVCAVMPSDAHCSLQQLLAVTHGTLHGHAML
jgi:hypothetical protein